MPDLPPWSGVTAQGPVGPPGPGGPPGPPGPNGPLAGLTDVNGPFADGDAVRWDAAAQRFVPSGKVKFRTQGNGPLDLNPGSGVVRVEDSVGTRAIEITHYNFGSQIRTEGPSSHLLELFLGTAGAPKPTFSVRGNGQNLGANIQARDSLDAAGIALDFESGGRPKLQLEGTLADNTHLAVENHSRGGRIIFGVTPPGGGAVQDRAFVDNNGFNYQHRGVTSLLPRIIAGQLAWDGGVGITWNGPGVANVVRNGVGDYTINFSEFFVTNEAVTIATALAAAARIVTVIGGGLGNVRLLVTDAAGAAVDSSLNVVCMGR